MDYLRYVLKFAKWLFISISVGLIVLSSIILSIISVYRISYGELEYLWILIPGIIVVFFSFATIAYFMDKR